VSLWRSSAWGLLYLAASLALALESGLVGRAAPPHLERLPETLGPLHVHEELAFDPASLGSTPPERFTFRRVTDAAGHEGRLFLAYYARAQRWSGRPHDVEKCYAAQGWEERESHRLDEAHRPWSRRFEQLEANGAPAAIRVVHWLERPGPDDDRVSLVELGARLLSARGLRPDVTSIYFEFPAEAAPDDASATEAVRALSQAVESAWE
jgi:hypothetical protein